MNMNKESQEKNEEKQRKFFEEYIHDIIHKEVVYSIKGWFLTYKEDSIDYIEGVLWIISTELCRRVNGYHAQKELFSYLDENSRLFFSTKNKEDFNNLETKSEIIKNIINYVDETEIFIKRTLKKGK